MTRSWLERVDCGRFKMSASSQTHSVRSISRWMTRNRVSSAMARAKAGADPDALVKAAADAGYDLSGARATLAALGGG